MCLELLGRKHEKVEGEAGFASHNRPTTAISCSGFATGGPAAHLLICPAVEVVDGQAVPCACGGLTLTAGGAGFRRA